ncbi:MAG: hypothetical protein ACRCWO_09065 [Bosea sp. (in: a-proteobacteria)]
MSLNSIRQDAGIERPQIVTKGSTFGRTIFLSILAVVGLLFIAPMVFAGMMVGMVSNEVSKLSDRDMRMTVRDAGPDGATLRMTPGPTPAQKASATPALTWPVDQLSGITGTHFLVQQTSSVREDRWAFGVPSSSGGFAGITLIQGDTDRFHRNGFLAEVMSAVKVNGSKQLTGPYYEFTTRFGSFNGRDVIINDGFRPRTCIGFVSAFEEPIAMLSGVYCSPHGKTADPGPVACMIDKIKFSPNGLQPSLAFLGEQSKSGTPICSSRSYHDPGKRSLRRDSKGRAIGYR